MTGCLFALLLSAVAGRVLAQAPFTISLNDTQFTMAENSTHSPIRLKRTGDSSAEINTTVTFTEVPGGKIHGLISGWNSGTTELGVFPPGINDIYFNPGRSYVVKLVSVDGGGAIGTPDTATVTVIDDEQPPKVAINDTFVAEGNPESTASTAQFTVSLTSALPQSVTTIPVVIHDASARAGTDYQTVAGPVVFGDGVLTTTLSVPIIRDHEPEADETFTVELFPSAPITAAKAIGTCTIGDDDSGISPLQLKIRKGTTGKITIDLVNPVAAPEQITLQPNTASLVSVPPVVTIPAGSSRVDVNVLGIGAGVGKILVTLAASRGSHPTLVDVLVDEQVSITPEPLLVNLTTGESANVVVHVVPPPSSPVAMGVTVTRPELVEVPAGIIIGTDGNGVIPIRAIDAGSATISVIPPEIFAASPPAIAVTVKLPGGLVITRLSAAQGGEAGGDAITIFGSDFNGPCVPTFGGAPARSVDAQTTSSILVTTPPHDAGIVDVAVRCGKNSFVSRNAFTYLRTRMAALTVFPAVGAPRGGSIVEIDGTNLHVDSCIARFGQTIAVPLWTNGTTSIGVVVPPHELGNAPLSLVCGNETATVPGGFNYVGGDEVQPRIEPFDPMWRAGEHAVLYGSHFRPDDVVLIDGVAVSDFTTLSRTQHAFTLPETPGSVQVKLLDAFGRTTVATVPIHPSLTPAATRIPNRVTLGSEFSIDGTGLRKDLAYKLGPALLQPVTITNTTALFRAPVSVGPGPLPFTISDHGSVIVTQSITLVGSGMAVSAVSPPCTAVDGGSLVTIFGSGFQDGAAVQFGRTYSADVAVKDGFTLVARLPPPFGDTQPRVTVSNPDGASATLTNSFNYKTSSESCSGSRHRAAGH